MNTGIAMASTTELPRPTADTVERRISREHGVYGTLSLASR